MALVAAEIFNVMMGQGYNDPYTLMSLGNGLGGGETTASFVEKTRLVFHQAMPAIPGTPGIAPTLSQINKLLNKDWSTWARSVSKLEVGSCCRFSISSGSSSAFVGIGGRGMEGSNINQFSHALVSDIDGIHVLENGVRISTLKNRQLSSSFLRIHRQGDVIIYAITTAAETIVFTSPTPYIEFREAYVYGMLYSSGDKVTSAEFLTGEVLFGSM